MKHNSHKYGYKTPEHLKAYDCWNNMMHRCYNQKCQMYRLYGGRGVHVCPEWHDFQEFAKFYYEDVYRQAGWQLDKDMLVDDNLIYSPETCCFVPAVVNNILNNYDHTAMSAERNALKERRVRALGKRYKGKLDCRLVEKLINFKFTNP